MYGMDHTSRHKVQPRSTAWTTPVGRIPPGLPDGERGRGGGALALCALPALVQGSAWEEGEGNSAGCSAVAVAVVTNFSADAQNKKHKTKNNNNKIKIKWYISVVKGNNY